MSEELRPCPFCNAINSDVGVILHTDSCYLMLKYMNAKKDRLIKSWNTRPLEDAKDAEIEQLKAALSEAGKALKGLGYTPSADDSESYDSLIPDKYL